MALINKNSPFIIAEMSGNHNQSLERALKIVDAAAKAGASAIKLQTFTPDTMTLDMDKGDFLISDPNSLWKDQSMYSLYQKAHTPWEWHKPIFERARKLGIEVFSSPFDESAVDFLESLHRISTTKSQKNNQKQSQSKDHSFLQNSCTKRVKMVPTSTRKPSKN